MRVSALAVLLVAARAFAQPAEQESRRFVGKAEIVLEVDDCRDQPNVPEEKKREIAAERFRRGQVLYAQGDYGGAVTELVGAYCTSPYYGVLKDIGQAYERQLEYEKAIKYFERFVKEVPSDAKRPSACEADPQDEKRNVLARISVLERLPARIRVDTEPSDTYVTLENDAGVAKSREPAGKGELEVTGGVYQMTIERAGYHTIQKEIVAEIGKPYTFFFRMQPVVGHLHVRVVPVDAKLYVDGKPMGAGFFDEDLPGGRYKLLAEAPDRATTEKAIEIVPDRDTKIAFEMSPVRQTGRRQLLAYGTITAGVASTLLASGGSSSPFYNALAFVGGVGGGFFGIYYGTPEDIELGTSSLTITSSLAGGVAGGALGAALTNRFDATGNAPSWIGGGLLVGAGIGYYGGRRTNPSAGDAAVINSGALWGTVSSSLFALSFGADPQISGAIVLSGLAMGTTAGLLLQRYFTISRGHAALIDASGVVGIVAGLATLSVFSRASGGSVRNDERNSNFALGGLAAGLVVGGVLTRNMDEPKLTVSPTLGTATSAGGAQTTTYGIGGSF